MEISLVVTLPPEIVPAPSPPPPRAPPPRPPPSPPPPPQAPPLPPPLLCRPIYGRGDCSERDGCGAHAGRGACVDGLCRCFQGYGGDNCSSVISCHRWDAAVSAWSQEGLVTSPPPSGAPDGWLYCRANADGAALPLGTEYAGLLVDGSPSQIVQPHDMPHVSHKYCAHIHIHTHMNMHAQATSVRSRFLPSRGRRRRQLMHYWRRYVTRCWFPSSPSSRLTCYLCYLSARARAAARGARRADGGSTATE